VYETAALRDDDNEYAAELRAIRKALRILRSQTPQTRQGNITILTDCQSAMKSLRRPQQQSGQYIIQEILQVTAGLRAQGTKVTLQWVPGHEGVRGNELAHKYAQKSTTRGNEVDEEPAPRLKSQALSARILKERERLFNRTLAGMFTRTIDRALPKKHMAKVYDTLSRQDAVILVQLRTGHLGLNSHLARIRRADSTVCQCGAEEETVRHFLFQCPQWSAHRRALQEALGERRGDLSFALGGWSGRIERRTGKQVDGSKEKWKPDMAALKAVIQFVKATERLQSQVVPREEEGEERGEGQREVEEE
jgi:ribonuclease HI